MSAERPSNFLFLKAHDQQLVRLGLLAERYFAADPNTRLLKLRHVKNNMLFYDMRANMPQFGKRKPFTREARRDEPALLARLALRELGGAMADLRALLEALGEDPNLTLNGADDGPVPAAGTA